MVAWNGWFPIAASAAGDNSAASLPTSTLHGQAITGHVGPAPADGAITYAYAGDSITARSDSWLHVLADDPQLNAVDGYARSGARSDQVRAHLPTTRDVEVLVIEVGTNDINQRKTLQSIVANINAIAATSNTEQVLLTAAPPSDKTSSRWGVNRQEEAEQLNVLLSAEAKQYHWTYIDPYASFRQSDNGWAAGSSTDGIHPTAAANRTIAQSFSAGIQQAADSSRVDGSGQGRARRPRHHRRRAQAGPQAHEAALVDDAFVHLGPHTRVAGSHRHALLAERVIEL
ncbi:SGNH/GDSL hydrolase family protein [Rathayibacter sp. ZW T2_19]|uniref:SGNH/GDSL hydrolase family protein n=1 Tax=Rathayibacter rubneri TaxID=2950106 RepID=A0A9X2DVW4_9MICO|nr:SGNH/GDSL hydrolase family protein [Rathayibacter rubneri]MCM6761166.1 SGNH/GDSL hydrolase family protein [Rathayibacter rubneri]